MYATCGLLRPDSRDCRFLHRHHHSAAHAGVCEASARRELPELPPPSQSGLAMTCKGSPSAPCAQCVATASTGPHQGTPAGQQSVQCAVSTAQTSPPWAHIGQLCGAEAAVISARRSPGAWSRVLFAARMERSNHLMRGSAPVPESSAFDSEPDCRRC